MDQQIKFCKDCKWCKPVTLLGAYALETMYAYDNHCRCMFSYEVNLVTGDKTYPTCVEERAGTGCRESGDNWEKKVDDKE